MFDQKTYLIFIGNVNNIDNLPEPHHYCGRANKRLKYNASALQNPYVMRNELQRDEVCDNYKNHFYTQIKNKNQCFIDELRYIHSCLIAFSQITLLCYCAPKRCHCETIKEYLRFRGYGYSNEEIVAEYYRDNFISLKIKHQCIDNRG